MGRYRWLDTDDSQILRQRPPIFILFLQIYMIHENDLFQGENCEFCRKETSLHPWRLLKIFVTLYVSFKGERTRYRLHSKWEASLNKNTFQVRKWRIKEKNNLRIDVGQKSCLKNYNKKKTKWIKSEMNIFSSLKQGFFFTLPSALVLTDLKSPSFWKTCITNLV